MDLPIILRPGEDGWIVAECPLIPGGISQGRTRAEALANIAEAVQLCLEVQAEEGWTLPAEYEVTAVAVVRGCRRCRGSLEDSASRRWQSWVTTRFAQRGSHVRLNAPNRPPVTVPLHQTLDRGTVRSIIRNAQLTLDEFLDLLDK